MIVGYQPSPKTKKIIKMIRTARKRRKLSKNQARKDRAEELCTRGYYKTLALLDRFSKA